MPIVAYAENAADKTIHLALNDLLVEPQPFYLDSNYSLKPAQEIKPGAKVLSSNANKDVKVSKITLDEQITLNPHRLPFVVDYQLSAESAKQKNEKLASAISEKGMRPSEAVFLLPQNYFKTMPETDLIALQLRGAGEWEVMSFSDMDAALNEEGDRYLPLVRLLNAFGVTATAVGEVLSFRTGSGSEIELNLANGRVVVNNQLSQTHFISGVSDITMQREIYLPTGIISRIFGFEIVWDDLLYQYVATTDDSLPIWERTYSRFMGMDAVSIPGEALPSRHDSAQPTSSLLGFVQAQSSIGANYRSEDSSTSSIATSSVKLWGNLWDGQYRMRMDLPTAYYSDNSGFGTSDRNVLVPSQIQWRKDGETSQLTLGDVGLALNDLAMPSASMTGVRFNGVGSLGEDSIDAQRSQYGINRSLVADKIYTGIAEIGSVVNLIVNDRIVDSRTVVADINTPIGFGKYEFDEIAIAGGSQSSIRIDIVEPSGVVVSIDKPSVSSAKLLPTGSYSYLGGFGTRRDYNDWGAEGLIGGARVLYGVAEKLSVGVSVGYQTGMYNSFGSVSEVSSYRGLPDSSLHFGTEFAAQIMPNLLLSGDLAMSSGESGLPGSDSAYNGMGMRLLTDWDPTERTKLRSQLFRYERGFYNGSSNTDLQDRQGYGVNLALPHTRWFAVNGGFGYVEDNLDGSAASTNAMSYQNLDVTTNALPYTSLRVGANHLVPDEGESKTRIEVEGYVTLPYVNLGFRKATNLGALSTGMFSTLLRGLALPGIELSTLDTTTLSAQVRLPENHNLRLSWTQNEYGGSAAAYSYSINHNWNGLGILGLNEGLPLWLKDRYLSISSSFNMDAALDEREIITYIGIPLRTSSRSTLRFTTSYNDNRGVYIGFDLDLESLFSTNDPGARLTRVPDHFNPNYGGVQGSVFLDLNANAVRDPEEPGISDIGVISSTDGLSMRTDSKGKFLIGKRPGTEQSQLYVDIDSVPANLKPTHALQTANLLNGAMTQVDFGLAPLISLSGVLKAQKEATGGDYKPMSGARVYVLDVHGNLVQESITASDGSYYLDVLPGKYALKIDTDTIKSQYIFESVSQDLLITGLEEYQEKDIPPIVAKLLSEDEIERIRMAKGGQLWDLSLPLVREVGEISLLGDQEANIFSGDLLKFQPGFDM